MAEGTSLLRMHTAYTCIVGSNPTVSARIRKKAPEMGLFFVHHRQAQTCPVLCQRLFGMMVRLTADGTSAFSFVLDSFPDAGSMLKTLTALLRGCATSNQRPER